MSRLLIGDLHLTDRPRDAYRFGIFKQIAKWQAEYNPDRTFILGDLCDQKDRHSATLVNRIVDELSTLKNIRILMGNHDYIDPNNPFFKFLGKLENVHFIDKPFYAGGVGAIPHCRTQEQFDKACTYMPNEVDILLLHNTIDGAISETGVRLSGLNLRHIPKVQHGIFAGDVHRPQTTTGGVVYVGAPYHIRFGDNFIPRCLLVASKHTIVLEYNAPYKWRLNISDPEYLKKLPLREGDQVKVTLNLAREEVPEWIKLKAQIQAVCKELKLEVYGIDLKVSTIKKQTKDVKITQAPTDILAQFCKHEGVGTQIKEAGLSILKDV